MVRVLYVLSAIVLLSACTKTTTQSTTSASPEPIITPYSYTSPGAEGASNQGASTVAPETSRNAGQVPSSGGASPDASASSRDDIPVGGASPAASPTPLQFSRPADGPPTAFDLESLLLAYASLPNADVVQADAVTYALAAARSPDECAAIRADFTDQFAAHRNADRYFRALKRRAKPPGMMAVTIPVNIEPYDFDKKGFPLHRQFGPNIDGIYPTPLRGFSAFATMGNCVPNALNMPDKSTVPTAAGFLLENDPVAAGMGDLYSVDPAHAETFWKGLPSSSYQMSEQIDFYLVSASRGMTSTSSNILVVGHPTKFTIEIFRAKPGARVDRSASATILYTKTL